MAKELLTSPLNEIPQGLLDFFGIKSMGQYPQRLDTNVMPTMDLLAWYLASKVDIGMASTTAPLVANTGQTTFGISSAQWTTNPGSFDFAGAGVGTTTVPDGQVWMLEHCSIRWTMSAAAGDIADFSVIAIASSVAPAFITLTDGPVLGYTNSAAGLARAGARAMTRGPIFLLPASQLRVQCFGVTTAAGNVDYSVAVRIRRLGR